MKKTLYFDQNIQKNVFFIEKICNKIKNLLIF